jgi:hypothetical protein
MPRGIPRKDAKASPRGILDMPLKLPVKGSLGSVNIIIGFLNIIRYKRNLV